MADQNPPDDAAPQQPAAEKDYAALYKQYSEDKEYGKDFLRMIREVERIGLNAQETEEKKREIIDSWPERVRRQRILDKLRDEREDLDIYPGSA